MTWMGAQGILGETTPLILSRVKQAPHPTPVIPYVFPTQDEESRFISSRTPEPSVDDLTTDIADHPNSFNNSALTRLANQTMA